MFSCPLPKILLLFLHSCGCTTTNLLLCHILIHNVGHQHPHNRPSNTLTTSKFTRLLLWSRGTLFRSQKISLGASRICTVSRSRQIREWTFQCRVSIYVEAIQYRTVFFWYWYSRSSISTAQCQPNSARCCQYY